MGRQAYYAPRTGPARARPPSECPGLHRRSDTIVNLPALQRHPRRRSLALDASGGHGADVAGRRSRATEWPSTSTAACSSASRCRAASSRFRDGQRELVARHYKGDYLNSPNDVVARGLDGSIYFTDPDYGRWNDWIGCKREFVRGYKGVFRVPPGGGDGRARGRRGRVRTPERPLLLPRREPALRQRLATRRGQGLRRRRRRLLGDRALFAEGIGLGDDRQRATSTAWSATSTATSGRHGPGRRVGAHAGGRADRRHRDARDLRQRVLGRRRPATRCSSRRRRPCT